MLHLGPVSAHLREMAATQLQAFALLYFSIRYLRFKASAACLHAGRPAAAFAQRPLQPLYLQWPSTITQQGRDSIIHIIPEKGR